MACGVALKRSLELDPHHSPESVVKRSRLSTYLSASASSPPALQATSSSSTGSPQTTTPATPGALGGSAAPSLTPTQLQSYLKAEIKHLRRRKILPRRSEAAPRSPPRSGSSSEDETPAGAARRPETSAGGDRSSFTLPQVQQICARLLSEQEDRLRAHFEGLLQHKLTEQYETFVRFTHDQIQRRKPNDEVPSYLS